MISTRNILTRWVKVRILGTWCNAPFTPVSMQVCTHFVTKNSRYGPEMRLHLFLNRKNESRIRGVSFRDHKCLWTWNGIYAGPGPDCTWQEKKISGVSLTHFLLQQKQQAYLWRKKVGLIIQKLYYWKHLTIVWGSSVQFFSEVEGNKTIVIIAYTNFFVAGLKSPIMHISLKSPWIDGKATQMNKQRTNINWALLHLTENFLEHRKTFYRNMNLTQRL